MSSGTRARGRARACAHARAAARSLDSSARLKFTQTAVNGASLHAVRHARQYMKY